MPTMGLPVPSSVALRSNYFGGTQRPPTPTNTPLSNQYRLYNSAVAQDATDRSGIMQGYRDLMGQAPRQMAMPTGNAYTPQMAQYNQSAESADSIRNLADLSRTGGYSDQNIQDMRARSISPIRSIYSNALREVDRNRRLQGGFSPNYNAARTRMAHDLSTQIGDISQNVEGDLAERQAAGRRGVAGTYASAAGEQSNLANTIGSQNVDRANTAGQFNLQFPLQVGSYNNAAFQNQIAPLQGMQSLYGTTPANSALFGNQALQHATLQNTMDDQTQNNQLQLIGNAMRSGGSSPRYM